MKVGIEYNQVEITLQALNGSAEEVIFGTAPLQHKAFERFTATAHFLVLYPRANATKHLNVVIFSNPLQFPLVLIYCFFYVVHLRTQGDNLVNLREKRKRGVTAKQAVQYSKTNRRFRCQVGVKSRHCLSIRWFTSSITCCPLDNLLIKVWMTWNTGLGSGVVAFSTLRNAENQAQR